MKIISQKIKTRNKLDSKLLFIISPFKEVIKRTQPHTHGDYYEMIFLSQGHGYHRIEDKNYLIMPPECYWLNPGQLHYWEFTSVPKGYVVLFKESFFDPVDDYMIIEKLHLLKPVRKIIFSHEDSPEEIFKFMLKEFLDLSELSADIHKGSIQLLLSYLIKHSKQQEENRQKPASVFNHFLDLVSRECSVKNRVADFALRLNISPQNLNVLCHKESGKSAGKHLRDKIMLDAKRYLIHTDQTISEIAYTLDFTDTSHFIKYFKRSEGLTPAAFRSKYFQ